MRKIFVGLLALLVSASVLAERVTQEDAALVANNFMNVAAANTGAKKAPAKRMVLKQAPAAQANQYFIYENASGEGCVMVAANDVVRPILAYSETGHFRTDNMPSNITRWLGKYNKFIQNIEADGAIAGLETTAEWNALRRGARKAKGDAVVGPLVQTQWDQDAPYNDLCPGSGSSKAYTGCVATAMAQVMNYWKWPVKGTGSRTYQPMDPNSNTGAASKRYGQQTANFGNTTYDWSNMKTKHNTSDTQAQKTAISTLMYHCGVATDMMYGNSADGGSGTYTVNYGDWNWSDSEGECAQNALYMFFGYKQATGYMRSGYTSGGYKYYDAWTDDAWTAMVKAELDKQRPIMYAGAGSGGGHSFICDGYDNAGYFHFNWGWSGSNDGYYRLSQLAPGSGGAGGGSYDFSEDQDVIIGIEPNITGHTVVTNGTGCTISCASVIENNKALTATITPIDATYDFTSLSVKLGATTLSETTHYTLSSDKKTLSVKATAITGDATNNLTITAVWTKNRYSYAMLGENCTPEDSEGFLTKNAALNLTIMPASGYTLANAACWEVEMGGTMLTYGTGFTYNASNGAFSISSVTGDVVILASAGKEVTWMDKGTLFATTFTSGDKYTLPSIEPEACEGKVFVGWCATENYSSETTAPAFIKDGDAANQGYTLYAVFAEQSGAAPSTNTTYTFTSKSWDDATHTWSSQKDGNVFTDGQGVQVTSAASGAGASTTKSFSGVSKVVVNYCTNAKKGAGSVEVTIGGVTKSQDVTVSGGTSLRNLEYTFDNVSGTAEIEVTCGTNSIYINSITITTGGGTTLSNYTTNCVAPAPVYYTIRFFNNGQQIGEAQSVLKNHQAEKPTDPTPLCADYTFVGWSTAVVAGEVTEMPTLVTNFAATQDQDYYAVYSITEEEEGGGSGNITLNPASVSSFPYQGITLSVTDGTLTNGTDYRVYKNQTLTIESSVGAMSSIAFTYSSASYDGGGWAASYTPNAASWTSPTASGEQARITQIVITIGNGSSSTTYYTTAPTCEECTAAVTMIKGAETNGTFALNKVGEQSTCSGKLVVTISDIVPAHGYLFKEITQTGIEGAIIDQNAKTVTYAKKTNGASSINVVFEEKPKYTINFYDKGILVKTQEVYEGDEATKPADPTAACDDYTFVGWWTAELAADNKTAQSWVSDFTATKDQDYYAIYSKTETEEGGASASVTFKTASSDSNTDESSTAGAIRTYLVDTESGISSYSGSKVYAGENGAKLGSSKAAGSITLTLTQPITTKEVKVLAYQYGNDTGTLSVEANGATTIGAAQQPNGTTLSFTATSDIEISTLTVSTSSKRAYIKSIVIGGGASSTTYYSSVVSCTGTDIENTVIDCEKAVKVIENGQIVIVRGKEKYTIFGQKIQ